MMQLRYISGEDTGRTVNFEDKGIEIGRDPGCAVCLDDEDVSRHHGRIVFDGLRYSVEDLDSTNGVRVNGILISKTEIIVTGDRIGVGSHLFLFTDSEDVLPADLMDKLQRHADKRLGRGKSSGGNNKAAEIAVVSVALVIALSVLVWLFARGPSSEKPNIPDGDIDYVEGPVQPDEPPPRRPSTPRSPHEIFTPEDPNTPEVAETTELYFWADSEPRGASVQVDDQPAGVTPVLLRGLGRGSHTLIFSAPGYKVLERAVHVPAPTQSSPFRLAPSDASCRVSSNPPGVAVTYGNQLLGRTPFLMHGYAAGDYRLSFIESGFDSRVQTAKINAYRATSLHVDMSANTGALDVVTTPPGASVYLDTHFKGMSQPDPVDPSISQPMHFTGLKAGDHVVEIEHDGERSRQRARVVRRDTTTARLMIWKADTQITTISGTVHTGAIVKRNAAGDIVFATSPDKRVTLLATEIRAIEPLAADDVLDDFPEDP
ncbi:MAG: pSer/pThr/pTyr-binding forkhead associated (FHA) protein [Rhodothermales bacterium]|jgi:pSer/pThr/pTyr-binding forkhead associated (FHA) protein